MKKRSKFGWMELIVGILLILLGMYSMIRPGSMLTGIVMIYGAVAVITGIADLVFYMRVGHHIGFGPTISLMTGVLSVMTGFMLLVYPGAGKWVLSMLFPIWFIAHCISGLSHLNIIRYMAGRFIFYSTMILNMIGLVLGILMIFRPVYTIISVGWIIGFYLILLGINSIVIAVGKTGSEW